MIRSQDRLLAPDQVGVDDTGLVLVFRVENQHVARWGIPLSAVTERAEPVEIGGVDGGGLPTGVGEDRGVEGGDRSGRGEQQGPAGLHTGTSVAYPGLL